MTDEEFALSNNGITPEDKNKRKRRTSTKIEELPLCSNIKKNNLIDDYSVLPCNNGGLRPYQIDAKKDIYAAWNDVDEVMFQMPTGCGKTILFSSIIYDVVKWGEEHSRPVHILVIAHRKELIEQIGRTLEDRYRIHHGYVGGGYEKKYNFPVQVSTIQSHCKDIELQRKRFDFIFIDEAHHTQASSYKKLWRLYPYAKKLGVTATPYRLDGKGFKDIFRRLVLSPQVEDFIRMGYLAPFDYLSIKDDSFVYDAIKSITEMKAGDYDEVAMERIMNTGKIRAQLLDSYLKYAKGKKGIIYSINLKHSKSICEDYRNAGIRIVEINGKTPAKERKLLVDKFRKGEIDVIVNVDIFSEGFDCPDIEFIQLARPTKSLSIYLQQVGRGLRIHENKVKTIILDNVGLYKIHKFPDTRRKWKYHFEGKAKQAGIRETGSGGYVEPDYSEGNEKMVKLVDSKKFITPETLGKPQIFKDNGYFGLKLNNEIKIQAKYKRIEEFFEDRSIIQDKRGKYGIIDPEGRMLRTPDYDLIETTKSLTNKICWVCIKGAKIECFDSRLKSEISLKERLEFDGIIFYKDKQGLIYIKENSNINSDANQIYDNVKQMFDAIFLYKDNEVFVYPKGGTLNKCLEITNNCGYIYTKENTIYLYVQKENIHRSYLNYHKRKTCICMEKENGKFDLYSHQYILLKRDISKWKTLSSNRIIYKSRVNWHIYDLINNITIFKTENQIYTTNNRYFQIVKKDDSIEVFRYYIADKSNRIVIKGNKYSDISRDWKLLQDQKYNLYVHDESYYLSITNTDGKTMLYNVEGMLIDEEITNQIINDSKQSIDFAIADYEKQDKLFDTKYTSYMNYPFLQEIQKILSKNYVQNAYLFFPTKNGQNSTLLIERLSWYFEEKELPQLGEEILKTAFAHGVKIRPLINTSNDSDRWYYHLLNSGYIYVCNLY